jgi:2OG-Fe dioxygenase
MDPLTYGLDRSASIWTGRKNFEVVGKSKTMARVRCSVDVKGKILKRRFYRTKPAEYLMPKKIMLVVGTLTEGSRARPLEPRAENGERGRRYRRFRYAPWSDNLSVRPLSAYNQDWTVNNDDGRVSREFAALTPALKQNTFLANLIRLDIEQLPITGERLSLPWDVGIHRIQMFARPGVPEIYSVRIAETISRALDLSALAMTLVGGVASRLALWMSRAGSGGGGGHGTDT